MKNLLKNLIAIGLTVYMFNAKAQTCDMYVGGYVTSYRDASPSLIDYSKISHAFYAFGKSNSSGALIIDSSIYVPAGNFTRFKNATVGKSRYLSLEGGSGNTIRDMATIPSARTAFVTNCVNFCSANGFTGIDMDWENIDNSSDSANFHSLVSALSASLHANGYQLIITLSYNYNARYYGVASLNKADWIQLMTYDETGFYGDYGNHSPFESIAHGLDYWASKGFTDKSKIVIGLPFYGYLFPNYSPNQTGTAKTYAEIITANSNLKTDVDTLVLTQFNSAAMIKRKVDYAKFSGLKGVFIWEMGQDLPSSNSKSLLRAVADAACDQNPVWIDYSMSCETNVATGKSTENSSDGILGYNTHSERTTDNDIATVWSAAATDTEWVHVDLGNTYDICKVEIVWAAGGAARDFEIKVAPTSNGPWTTIQQRYYNSSLTNTLQGLYAKGRFVSFQGIDRGCISKYKMAEFRVYGSLAPAGRLAPTAMATPVRPVVPAGIKVFPNPSTNIITIDMTGLNEPATGLEIIDNTGKTMRAVKLKNSNSVITMDINELTPGMYFIKTILQSKKILTQKIVKGA